VQVACSWQRSCVRDHFYMRNGLKRIFWMCCWINYMSGVLQVLRGWCANQSVQELQRLGSEISFQPANEDILKPMERRWLGYQGWTWEDRLVQGTLYSFLQELPHRWVWGLRGSEILCHTGYQMVGPEGVPGSWCLAIQEAQMGTPEIHHLQLLHW